MSAKSQFLASNGVIEGGNLLGSMAIAMADVTKGPDAKTQKLMGEMRDHAQANSNGQRVTTYLAKLTPEVKQAAPAARTTVKMGSMI